MLRADDVTACLVTRGDQPDMMERIRESLIFERVIVYDNSKLVDCKTFGRYALTHTADTDLVYFQDDDVIVPRDTQEALLAYYEPGIPTAVYAHGETPGGYDDLPLVGSGAIVDQHLCRQTFRRWQMDEPTDEAFAYYCDFAIGVLYPRFKHVRLPFHIELAVAQHPSRLCNQPWAAEMKAEVTRRARAIRDQAAVAA